MRCRSKYKKPVFSVWQMWSTGQKPATCRVFSKASSFRPIYLAQKRITGQKVGEAKATMPAASSAAGTGRRRFGALVPCQPSDWHVMDRAFIPASLMTNSWLRRRGSTAGTIRVAISFCLSPTICSDELLMFCHRNSVYYLSALQE